MHNKYRLGLAALLSTAALASVALSPASATTIVATPDANKVTAAQTRISTGTYTADDLAYLRQFPEIAAVTPDPTDVSAPTITQVNTSPPTVRSGQPTAQALSVGTCGYAVLTSWRKKSLVGQTLYVWNHYMQFCHTSTKMTQWQASYDYVSQASSVIDVRERIVNYESPVGYNSMFAHIQRHLEYCILQYGCYANTYPWDRVTLYVSLNGLPDRYTWVGSNA